MKESIHGRLLFYEKMVECANENKIKAAGHLINVSARGGWWGGLKSFSSF